jgi:ornithine cyclodeaminase
MDSGAALRQGRADMLKFIDADTAARLLDLPSLIEAFRAGHRAAPAAVGHTLLEQSSSSGLADRFLIHTAWQGRSALGAKLVTVFPGNAETSKPTIASVYVLLDGSDGMPLAVIDATPLTVRKTGADSALAADYLARPNVRTLLMMGAGQQAPFMIAAHRAVRPRLDRILIWNRSEMRASALARMLRSEGLDASVVTDAAAAAGEADIISCATAATSPILRGAWLKPGTHVDLVGAFTPAMRESDDDLMRVARLYVDTRQNTVSHVGDLCGPMASCAITEAHVVGDLYALVRGDVAGRRDDAEITVFKNGGGGHLDLMAARLLYARVAEAAG